MSIPEKSTTPPEGSTIDTIAAACRLSRTTVSAVLRGQARRYRIAAGTEARIRAAAEQSGWRPNYFARGLNKKPSATIGVLFPDVFERFMGETIRGIESVLQQADYRMLLSTSRFDPDEELRTVAAFRYRQVDGLIIAPYAPFAGSASRAMELQVAIGPLPCVVIDRKPDGLDPIAAGYDFVVQGDRDAAYRATRRLALGAAMKPAGAPEAGRIRRVAYLGFDLAASSLRDRRRGYQDGAAEFGFEPREVLLRERDAASEDLRRAVRNLQADRSLPEAWLVSTEGLAYKLAALLREGGNPSPAAVPIARFGIDPPFLPTGLIGLRQPHREMGSRAAELLLQRFENGGAPHVAEQIVLPVHPEPSSTEENHEAKRNQ
jgi:DNA-binding LacI/PurR family transcriptional regulator